MKILGLLAFLLISYSSFAQAPYSPIKTPIIWNKGGFDSLFVPDHDTLTPKDKTRSWITVLDTAIYVWKGTKWAPFGGAGTIVSGDPNNSGTIAQLRAMSTNTGKVYIATDRGGGIFTDEGLDDASTVDDGALILHTANGHRLRRQITGNINPIWFGADPTGVANSTPAIQAAINAAAALTAFQSPQDPGKIIITDGIYKIKGSGLTMPSGVSIEGNGRVVFSVDSLTAGQYAISLTNNSTTRKTTISGITFTDNLAAGTKKGLNITSHDNIITGCKFYSLAEGIKIDGFNGNVLEKNFFYNHKIGIYLYGFASQTYIEHNNFFAGLSTGTASIKLNDAASPTPLQSVFITDNWFEGNVAIPDILGRFCSNVYINRFWAEDYAQTWSSPRIDIDQTGTPVGNISISESRIVVKAGTLAPIRVNGGSVSIEKVDIHQDNEVPTIDLAKSAFARVNRIRFASIEAETEGLGFGVNIKGGVKVVNEDIEESTNQPWSVGGIQVRDGKNIIFDSEFKTGHHLVSGGATPPTLSLDNTTGAFDSSSAKIAFPTSAAFASNARHSKDITAAVGDNIRLAFWAKTDGPPHRILANLAGVASLPNFDIYVTNKWKKFYISADSIATAGAYYLYLKTYGISSPLNVWIDDIQAEVGANVEDFSAYVPNNTASGEVSFGKGVQLPTYYMGETKFDRGSAAHTDPNEKRASIRWNDKPINGSPVGWVTTTKGLSRGFGLVDNVPLEWVGKSSGVNENNTNGLTLTSSNTSFGNVARSKEIFTANAGMLTAKIDRTVYGAGSQAFIGFTVQSNFTTWVDLLLGVYWSPTGLTPTSTAFGLGDPIPGVAITDFIRLRPTDVNTYIDKSSDGGLTWTQIYTPPVPIILSGDNYVGVDFNGTGGDKSINYITQSVNGEYDAKFLLRTKVGVIGDERIDGYKKFNYRVSGAPAVADSDLVNLSQLTQRLTDSLTARYNVNAFVLRNAGGAGDSTANFSTPNLAIFKRIIATGEASTTSTDTTLTLNVGGNNRIITASATVLSSDKTLVLPEVGTNQTLTLPTASTMQNKRIVILCKSTTVGRWLLSGSFVQKGTTGTMPLNENFINSGLVGGTDYKLESTYTGSGWKWFEID